MIKLNLNKINPSEYDVDIDSNCFFYHGELFTGMCTYDNDIYYYKNGLLHREDGPAAIRPNRKKEYWIDGNLIYFNIKLTKSKKFIIGKS